MEIFSPSYESYVLFFSMETCVHQKMEYILVLCICVLNLNVMMIIFVIRWKSQNCIQKGVAFLRAVFYS